MRFVRVCLKAGERASYAAVRDVNAVSPPPEEGISRTQKKLVDGTLGVKVWSTCQRSYVVRGPRSFLRFPLRLVSMMVNRGAACVTHDFSSA